MFWLIPAVIGTQLAGAYMQSKAASKAAAAQTKANTQATAESARQFDAQMAQYRAEQDAALQRYYATQSALSPYTQTGTSALLQQRALLGLDPDREAMIKQANAEYERKVAEAKKTIQPTQSAINTASNAGGIAGAYSSGGSLKPGSFTSAKSLSEYSGLAKSGGIRPGSDISGYSEPSQGKEAGAIESGAREPTAEQAAAQAAYDKSLAQAEADRQKAIDYANSLPSGSDAQKAAIAAIEQGSEFTELAKQGETGILANASATGGLRGGNTQGALAQFRPSLLNSLINQQYERLGSLSGMGMSSILGGAGYSGAQTQYPSGQNTIDLILNQGAINAGTELAKGNAWASIPNAFASGLGMYGAMGGFSSTQNRGTNLNSGYNIPGYMQGSLTSPF